MNAGKYIFVLSVLAVRGHNVLFKVKKQIERTHDDFVLCFRLLHKGVCADIGNSESVAFSDAAQCVMLPLALRGYLP